MINFKPFFSNIKSLFRKSYVVKRVAFGSDAYLCLQSEYRRDLFIENYGENSLENEKYQTMFLYPRNEYPSIRCSVVSDFSFQSREILNDDLEEELQPPTLNMSDLVKEKKLLKGKVR